MNATDYIQQAIDSCSEWHKISRECAQWSIATSEDCQEVKDGIWNVKEAKVFRLADMLKERIELAVDDLPNVTWEQALVVQMVANSLGQINYNDMARFYLNRESECAQ